MIDLKLYMFDPVGFPLNPKGCQVFSKYADFLLVKSKYKFYCITRV